MSENQTTRRRATKAWGGFTDNKLCAVRGADYGGELLCAIYPNKTAAQKAFEDVRPMEISWSEKRG